MYRMKDILRNVPSDDPRRQNTILYLNTSEESDYSLTIIQDDIKVSIHGNEIYGFKNICNIGSRILINHLFYILKMPFISKKTISLIMLWSLQIPLIC